MPGKGSDRLGLGSRAINTTATVTLRFAVTLNGGRFSRKIFKGWTDRPCTLFRTAPSFSSHPLVFFTAVPELLGSLDERILGPLSGNGKTSAAQKFMSLRLESCKSSNEKHKKKVSYMKLETLPTRLPVTSLRSCNSERVTAPTKESLPQRILDINITARSDIPSERDLFDLGDDCLLPDFLTFPPFLASLYTRFLGRSRNTAFLTFCICSFCR